MRRLIAAAAFLSLASCAAQAQAQDFPNHPIRLLVPSTAGGSVDRLSRVVGKWLQDRLGQPVVVENRAGAGGVIAAEATAKAAPDGYTLFMGTVSSLATAASLQKISYDPVRDFAPITLVAVQDLVLLVRSDSSAKTVSDIIALARANPQAFTYSSAGRGTGGHLSGELFSQLTGVPMQHIPYKGIAPAMMDVIGGQVTCTFASLASAYPLVASGQLRPIAVTGSKRAERFPNVPTMNEAGVKGYESSTWYAIVAPAGTPAPILQKLNAEITSLLKQPATREQFKDEGIELVGDTSAEVASYMKSEIAKWNKVIKSANLNKAE